MKGRTPKQSETPAPVGLQPVVKRRGLQIEWRNDIPAEMMTLARKRTRDMLAHYGRNITSMPIETLVASCYLQGIEDCFKYHEKCNTPTNVI